MKKKSEVLHEGYIRGLKKAHSIINEMLLNERIGGNKYANFAIDCAEQLKAEGKSYDSLDSLEKDVIDLFVPKITAFDMVSPHEAMDLWKENIEDISYSLNLFLGKKGDDKETRNAVEDVEQFLVDLSWKLDELYDDYTSDRYDELVPKGFKIRFDADNAASVVASIWNVNYDSTTDTATFDLIDYSPITVSKIKERTAPFYAPDIFSSEGVEVRGDGVSEMFGVNVDVVYCDMSIS